MCFCQMLDFHQGRHQAVCKFAGQWMSDYYGSYQGWILGMGHGVNLVNCYQR